jgi:thermitase
MRRRWALAPVLAAGTLLLAATAAAFTPSDPAGEHPAYEALDLPAAWDIMAGSSKVVIAIVDSGVDAAHAELQGRVDEGYDFVANRWGALPVDGHGTGVASVAAGRANNGLGGVGACFECRSCRPG